MQEGDAFGELALMYNTPRAATVKCTEGGNLWELSRSAYRAILITDNQTNDATTNDFLRRVPVFEGLTPEQLSRLASACETETFDLAQRVVSQGDPAEHIYILVKGNAYGFHRLGPPASGPPASRLPWAPCRPCERTARARKRSAPPSSVGCTSPMHS